MVKWIRFYGMIAALAFAFGSADVGKAQTGDLVGMLTSQLGVSQQQASGGAGSLLSFAKDQMSAGDFDVVSSALPGVDSLIGAAPGTGSSALSSGSSLLGGSLGGTGSSALSSGSSLLGGSSGGLGEMAGVASTFSDLGMSPDMVNQFVPVILDYAQTSGSEQAMQLLQGALTGL